MNRLRELNRRFAFTKPLDRWRVRFANGYMADRRIFLGAIALIVVLFLVVLTQVGTGRHIYVECPADAYGASCKNPFIDEQGFCIVKDAELCSLPILLPGTSYGERPPLLAENFGLFSLIIVIVALALNHIIYNRRFKP